MTGMAVEQQPPPPRLRERLRADGEARRFWNITVMLARTEFKTRYFGSVLGYLWSLMRPLMLFGVLYLVFTHIVRFGGGIEHYPLKLLIAIVLWSYFAEATGQSLTSLVQRESLLRKVRFHPAAIPLSVAVTSGFNLAFNLCVVVFFILVTGIAPAASWLEIVPLIGLLLLITAATSILLSVLYVPFRDMAPIWEVATQMLFWGTPIIYVIETVSSHTARHLLMMNPIAVIIEQARHALIDPSAPSAAAASGGAARLLIPAALTAALLVVSLLLYRRAEPTIAERL